MEVTKIAQGITKTKAPSFKGVNYNGRDMNRVAKKAVDAIVMAEGGPLKYLRKLGEPGEILNILVTGIGTAFVAPIFIMFNPMSKEDKNTKTYSAMRQPISAVIATAVQLGIVDKFNKHLDKLASTGMLNDANLSGKPKDSFLKKAIKLENPGISKENLKTEIDQRKYDAFWDAVRGKIEQFKEKPFLINTEKHLMTNDFYNEAKELLKNEDGTFKELLKHEKKNRKTIEEQITTRAIKLIDDKLDAETAAKCMIIKAGKDESRSGMIKGLEDLLGSLKETDPEYTEAKNALDNAIARVKGAKLSHKKLGNIYNLAEGFVPSSAENCEKELFEYVGNNVKLKRFVASGINNAEVGLSTIKKYGGIALALATLPFTCAALNWAYPRIMEKLMPEVANAKKAKGASK